MIKDQTQLIQKLEEELEKQRLENLNLKSQLKELHLVQEKFFKVFHDNQALMAIVTREGKFVNVNNTALKKFDFRAEEIIDTTLVGRNLWADTQVREEMINQLNANGYIDNFECTLNKKSGEKINLMCSIRFLDINGEQCMLVSASDISEHKKAGEALVQSQKLLYQIFNHTPLPIIIIAAKDMRVIEANDTFLSRCNLDRAEVLRQKTVRFNDWEDPHELDHYLEMIMQDGLVKNFEMKNRLSTGEIRTLLISGVKICWQGEECILSIGNDITELRKYQNEMLRMGNLNLIGQMAAGIADEIRNPMTSVKGFLQLFGSQNRFIEEKKIFDLIIEELDRANDIITTFSSLAQKNTVDLKFQSLNDNIINMFPLIMAEAMKSNIFVKMELSDVAPIMIDDEEIRKLLSNLVRNGMDAMSRGGILTIRTFQDKNGVNLAIQDKGHGIPPEIRGKIGTPFFTTKAKRTGLGLAVCYSIAARHNARIEIKTGSEGTVFDVIFPVSTQEKSNSASKSVHT